MLNHDGLQRQRKKNPPKQKRKTPVLFAVRPVRRSLVPVGLVRVSKPLSEHSVEASTTRCRQMGPLDLGVVRAASLQRKASVDMGVLCPAHGCLRAPERAGVARVEEWAATNATLRQPASMHTNPSPHLSRACSTVFCCRTIHSSVRMACEVPIRPHHFIRMHWEATFERHYPLFFWGGFCCWFFVPWGYSALETVVWYHTRYMAHTQKRMQGNLSQYT